MPEPVNAGLELNCLYEKGLFRNLEFTGVHHFSTFILQLENIDTTIEVAKVYNGSWTNIVDFINFLSKKIVYLEGVRLIVTFLKIEIDNGSSRVRVKLNDSGSGLRFRGRWRTILAVGCERQ